MSARRVAATALLFAWSISSAAQAVASAELVHSEPYVYGRFDARVRYAAGDGVVSSFFLWKEGSEIAGTFWNELDFEKLGADCHLQSNPLYGNPVAGDEQVHSIAADLCASYHDYRFEWTPSYIAWFVDGQEIRRETGDVADAFAQNAAGGMTFHFNVWPGNEDFGGSFNPAILPVHQYISWVQYSSYQNGSFQVEWREEFDSGSLPNGWTTGNWASPFELSTHTAQNVTFINGIAVLSLTADEAPGFSGTPPVDDDASVTNSTTAATTGSATTGSDTTGSDTTGSGTTGSAGTGGSATAGATSTAGTSTGGSGGAATVAGATTSGANTASATASSGTTTVGNTNGGPASTTSSTTSDVGDSGANTQSTGDSSASVAGQAPSGDDSGCACRLSLASGHPGRHAAFAPLVLLLWATRRWARSQAGSGARAMMMSARATRAFEDR